MKNYLIVFIAYAIWALTGAFLCSTVEATMGLPAGMVVCMGWVLTAIGFVQLLGKVVK